VLDSCRHLELKGFKVTYLPVQPNGILDLALLEEAITDETAIVSVMAVNNEIGVVQPIDEIGRLCRAKKVKFHTDAAQAVGKIPVDVNASQIDLMSISAHKIYGPKGVGALYVRRKPRTRLEPIMSGGGQERGLRSGTAPHPAIVGFGAAAEICEQDMEYDAAWIQKLSNRLREGIESRLSHVTFNGDQENGYPGCSNYSFAFVEGESLLMGLKGLAVSSGSACTSASLEPSYVLRALGVEDELAHTSIRFGIGRFTTEAEIDYALNQIEREVLRLRDMSPLWEMHLEGIDLKTIQWTQDH